MRLRPAELMQFPLFGGSLLAGSGVAQALLGFASNLVLVRYLSPADFGTYALALAVASTAFAVISLRLTPLIIRDPAVDTSPERRRMYVGALAAETLLAAIFATVAVAAMGGLTLLAGTVILAVGGNHALGTARAFYERRMPMAQLAAVESAAALASHTLAVFMVVGGAGALTLYLRDVVALLATAVGLWLVGGLHLPLPRRLSGSEWRALLREGAGLWLDGVAEGLFQRLTIMLAGWFGGSRDAGFFFQAQRLALVPQQILFPLVGRTAMVWLSRLGDPRSRRSGRIRLLWSTAAALGLAALCAIAFAEPIVPWLFGEAWRPVAPLLVLLSGYIMFGTLFEVAKVYCLATSRTPVLLIGRIAQYAVFLLALFPFTVGGYGSVGVLAGATSLAFAAAFGALLILILRAERLEIVSAR